MSKTRFFYYFVSYSYSGGFGRSFIRLANDLSLREIEEFIMDHDKLSDLVILFYKEISYEEFKIRSGYDGD